MFPHSIRWRLVLWLAVLLVCVLAGFGATIYQLQRIRQLGQIDEELEQRVSAVVAEMRPSFAPKFNPMFGPPLFGGGGPGHFEPEEKMRFQPPGGWPGHREFEEHEREEHARRELFGGGRESRKFFRNIQLSDRARSLFDETRTNGFYFVAWSRDKNVMLRSTNAPVELPYPKKVKGDARILTRTRDDLREAYFFTDISECVLVGRSITADVASLRRFAWLLWAAGGAVLALGLGGGWRIASQVIRPVEEISAAANRISEGNLSERINAEHTDNELGRLAVVLNSTFSRLESAFARQKQFTADASHELRTPLAVIISEAQTTLARERSAVEYRETVEACLDTARQMTRLTESLLQLARLDADHEVMQAVPFDLAEITRDCVGKIRGVAVAKGIKIRADLTAAPAVGEPEGIRQVITNLLMNAIHYNRVDGEVRVNTSTADGGVVLTVIDTGIGIAPDDLPHIFERFYRADRSRARAEGRSGLGLAITKAIVGRHKGRIEVTSDLGKGTTFIVRLPS